VTAIEALITGLVDYAGLFPPASLSMTEAVQRYREHSTGDDAWALGRFVVPASRLREFSTAFNDVCCGEREPPWGLSVLGSGDVTADAASIERLAQGAVSLDSLEVKVTSTAEAEQVLSDFAPGVDVFVEFEPGLTVKMLPVLSRFGARAKIRTGGVVAGAFPSVEVVAGFLVACARAKVAFKATAGLHHAVRSLYPLTYEPGSERALMHGFVNVFLAALLAYRGLSASELTATLAIEDASAFVFGADEIRWLRFRAGVDEIEALRREFALSYGSCSFLEPLDEVKKLGWL
jgi:hypothetical protein